MGDHTSTFLLISGEATALDTDMKRKRGDSLPRGTLPTTRSSKSPQVTGPWELDTVPGEEGKNRELASGASLRGDLLQVYHPARTRTRRMGRKPMPHTCQFTQHQRLTYVRTVWGGYSFSSGYLGNQYGIWGKAWSWLYTGTFAFLRLDSLERHIPL